MRIQTAWTGCAALFVAFGNSPAADDFTALVNDRAAVEHVYYNHRLGAKPPFPQVMPHHVLETLVREDQQKELLLETRYGVSIKLEMIEAEMERIHRTTRAPHVLREIETALGSDRGRFIRTVARPIVVERLLREKFENDDALHAPQRLALSRLRTELLAAKRAGSKLDDLVRLLNAGHSGIVDSVVWRRGEHVSEPAGMTRVDESQPRTAKPVTRAPTGNAESELPSHSFEEIPAALRSVISAHLRKAEDVSAVIEVPDRFLLYLCTQHTTEAMGVVAISLPKRGYDNWVQEQVQRE